MFGLTDFVIVIVVNAVDSNKKTTNHFDIVSTTLIAAENSIQQDTTGNPHRRSDIQKQAFPSDSITTIRQAYGFTGTNFNTHMPYVNGKLKSLSDVVRAQSEVVLIKNGIVPREAFVRITQHRIIPDRTGS